MDAALAAEHRRNVRRVRAYYASGSHKIGRFTFYPSEQVSVANCQNCGGCITVHVPSTKWGLYRDVTETDPCLDMLGGCRGRWLPEENRFEFRPKREV